MRKLATIQKIADVKPIDRADAIELVLIKGWQSLCEHKLPAITTQSVTRCPLKS